MAGVLQSNINLDEVQKLLYLYVRKFSFYGYYGGWKSELLVETPRGAVEEKFLLCNHCRGVLRDACLYAIDGIQELRCSACIPLDEALIVAQLNREIINTRQVRIIHTSALRLFALRGFADTMCPQNRPVGA